MKPFGPPPLQRLRIPPRDGGEHRLFPQQAHSAATVAAVRHLVETTRLTHKTIAHKTGVDSGTISRWRRMHGWTRPPGAAPSPRHRLRYGEVPTSRAIAQRLRMQAERLVDEMENAASVDPACLEQAIALLERARAEQAVRRRKPRRPPTPEEIAAHKAAQEADERVADEARRRKALDDRVIAQPAPGIASPRPDPYVWKWDRSASARTGWKRRYAKMRAAGQRFKTDIL